MYPNLPNIDPKIHFNASSKGNSREIYWQSFEAIVLRLLNAGKNVYILYPIPELPVHIIKAVMPFSILGKEPILDLEKTTSDEYYFKRNDFILSKLDSLSYGKRLHSIKPFDIFCDDGYCPAVKDKKALYFDDNHLSILGAELVVENIPLKNEDTSVEKK